MFQVNGAILPLVVLEMGALCKADRLVKKCRDDPKLPERRDLLALFIQAA